MTAPYVPTLTHPPPFNIGTGSILTGSGNPNGVITAQPRTFYVDYTNNIGYSTADGTTWTAVSGGSGSTQVFSGTGNPNGVVTATEPALYYDKGTGNLYNKTGSGNTGWN